MSPRRISAMLVRHWYSTIRSLDKQVDAFYWIAVDLVLWGVTATYLRKLAPGTTGLFLALIVAVVLWNLTYRAQADIGIGLLDELWAKNLLNLFASPLTLGEWITSLLIVAFVKSVIAVLFGAVLAFLLFGTWIFDLGSGLLPLFAVLVMSGWAVGFVMTGLIFRYTTRIQAVAWTFVFLLAPFSAVYYPVAALPPWAAAIASVLPMSYVFEEMRRLVSGAPIDYERLAIAVGLNGIYLTAGLLYLKRSYRRVLKNGLAKVY
jgi:ABC-2 type transport system permease protein